MITFVRITCEACGDISYGAIPAYFFGCWKCGAIMEVRKNDFRLVDKLVDLFLPLGYYDIPVIGHKVGQIENFTPLK